MGEEKKDKKEDDKKVEKESEVEKDLRDALWAPDAVEEVKNESHL